jgi:hypothetical protein
LGKAGRREGKKGKGVLLRSQFGFGDRCLCAVHVYGIMIKGWRHAGVCEIPYCLVGSDYRDDRDGLEMWISSAKMV